MNNDFNQNNQNGQNNGQQGNFYNPNGQQQGNFYNQSAQQNGYYNQNPQGFYVDPNFQRQNEAAKKAGNAKTLGIVALITAFVCTGIIPIVLGILALVNASSAKNMLGYDLPEGKSGRALGIASLIITGLAYVLIILLYVVIIMLAGAGALAY